MNISFFTKTFFILIFLTLFFCEFSPNLYAQEQQKEKLPEEIAAEEASRLEKELGLNPSQVFYVDSTLQHNFLALKEEFEKMRDSGMQDPKTYQTVREKWQDKNLASFKLIFTEQQYIFYLKMIGKGKEYKKGKDGLYYLKTEMKKKKS